MGLGIDKEYRNWLIEFLKFNYKVLVPEGFGIFFSCKVGDYFW